jgi:hypothetical protein
VKEKFIFIRDTRNALYKFTEITLVYLTHLDMDITVQGFFSISHATLTVASRPLILAVIYGVFHM